ncbi:hypothetical protein GYH30_051213 [Glycine max]|nr:hypothetical protein GYH30_051213 [Glycine max]
MTFMDVIEINQLFIINTWYRVFVNFSIVNLQQLSYYFILHYYHDPQVLIIPFKLGSVLIELYLSDCLQEFVVL